MNWVQILTTCGTAKRREFMVMMFRMIVMLVVMLDVDKMRNGLGGDSKEVQMQRRTPPYQPPAFHAWPR